MRARHGRTERSEEEKKKQENCQRPHHKAASAISVAATATKALACTAPDFLGAAVVGAIVVVSLPLGPAVVVAAIVVVAIIVVVFELLDVLLEAIVVVPKIENDEHTAPYEPPPTFDQQKSDADRRVSWHTNAPHSIANVESEKLPGDESTPFSTPADQYADHVLHPFAVVDWLGTSSRLVKNALMQYTVSPHDTLLM
jgi:hypothetical protein